MGYEAELVHNDVKYLQGELKEACGYLAVVGELIRKGQGSGARFNSRILEATAVEFRNSLYFPMDERVSEGLQRVEGNWISGMYRLYGQHQEDDVVRKFATAAKRAGMGYLTYSREETPTVAIHQVLRDENLQGHRPRSLSAPEQRLSDAAFAFQQALHGYVDVVEAHTYISTVNNTDILWAWRSINPGQLYSPVQLLRLLQVELGKCKVKQGTGAKGEEAISKALTRISEPTPGGGSRKGNEGLKVLLSAYGA